MEIGTSEVFVTEPQESSPVTVKVNVVPPASISAILGTYSTSPGFAPLYINVPEFDDDHVNELPFAQVASLKSTFSPSQIDLLLPANASGSEISVITTCSTTGPVHGSIGSAVMVRVTLPFTTSLGEGLYMGVSVFALVSVPAVPLVLHETEA